MLSRTTLFRLGLAAGSTLLSVLAAEVAVRFVAPHSRSVSLEDSVQGITVLRPNVHGRWAIPDAFDKTVSTNSERFRGRREFALNPPAGVLRIAALGDSLTFGIGANDDETYPAQLEQILTERWGSGRVEVLNAGAPGLGTGEEAMGFQLSVRRFHPQLVILNVFSNDAQDDVQTRVFILAPDGSIVLRPEAALEADNRSKNFFRRLTRRIPGYSFLIQHSELVNLLRHDVTALIAPPTATVTPEGLTAAEVIKTAQFYNREGLPLMAGEIKWLDRRVQEAGARLAVVYLPNIGEIYPERVSWAARTFWDSRPMVQVLSETCAREAIPFADLTGKLRRDARLSPAMLFYTGLDAHPTPVGYRAIAEGVASFVLEALRPQPPAAEPERQ